MAYPRRGFLARLLGIFAAFGPISWLTSSASAAQGTRMTRFGLHGKLIAHDGQRDALAHILLDAAKVVSALPGCEIYFVSTDEKDPMVAAFGESTRLVPLGGHGLKESSLMTR